MSMSTKQLCNGTVSSETGEVTFEPFVKRFEADATAFTRGLKTALLIEQFRIGFLPNAVGRNQRLQLRPFVS